MKLDYFLGCAFLFASCALLLSGQPVLAMLPAAASVYILWTVFKEL